MAKGKNVLTTGEVAKICNVAPRTVSKWFDNGQIKGYRIPGSKDRRIPVAELVRFMKIHDMPATAVPVGKIRVLIVDSDGDAADSLALGLKNRGDYEVRTAGSNLRTGAVVQKFTPHVLVVNLLAKGIDAAGICDYIRGEEDLQTIKIIALADSLGLRESEALMRNGFDASISDAGDVTEVIKKIEEVTAILGNCLL
jgi:excisionase family DNA binding protein